MKYLLLYIVFITCCGNLHSQSAAKDKPNIVWIVCEDISPLLGCYGSKKVSTPNIDRLATEGIKYTRAFTTAGVCAPSRSSIITGMYPTSIGTHHMRTGGDPKFQPVPSYSAIIPAEVKCFPEYLRMQGYYCTNNQKKDYQFTEPVTVWDESSIMASWKNRAPHQPFFAVFNFAITHESQLFTNNKDTLLVSPLAVDVPPIYPDVPAVRHDIARLYSNIEIMDRQVGELINMLKADGVYEDSYIFFYSDHGGALPWMKREVIDRGISIPLIVRCPQQQHAGTVNDELISGVDLAPTVLSLAGITIPAFIQGQAFLGKQKAKENRRYIYAARDRMDAEYDRVRAVRDKRYLYVYNYEPDKPFYQDIKYRYNMAMMKEILSLKELGKLGAITLAWFGTKTQEELYDTEDDPYQLHNLANDPAYKNKLIEMRTAFTKWTSTVGDMGSIPEKLMIEKWWNGKDHPPKTEMPVIKRITNGVNIYCETKGASVGFRVIKAGQRDTTEFEMVQSWDFPILPNPALNGTLRPAKPVWQVYTGEKIAMSKGDTLIVQALRIGYEGAEAKFVY